MPVEAGATLLEGVFEAIPDAVVVCDGDGRIVLANARCGAVFGRWPADLVGEQIGHLMPEWFRSGEGPGPADPVRMTPRRADGTEFPAEVSLARAVVDGASYAVVTIRDLTSRIREEKHFRSLLEAAPDATVIINADADIVLANDRVTEMLGYQRGALVGAPLAVLASTPGPDEVMQRIRHYLSGQRLSVPMGYSREFRVRHCDGHDVPVELSLSPLATDDGLLVSIALRDVTERRRLEAESQRMRDELIATVSHELRTPLTSVIGYAELMAELDDEDLSSRARKMLEVIERNASRELRLVDDLLTMAYLDDDRLSIERAAVDLVAIGERVAKDAALHARERGLTIALAAATIPRVHGDLFRIVQLLENLVTNSIKFTEPGGEVEIRVVDGGDRGVVEVRDTGVGVSPEEKERLFERLYRAPSAIANQVQGAGLGLSIAHAIVQAHEGSIEVESEIGVGTTVRVAIPYLTPSG